MAPANPDGRRNLCIALAQFDTSNDGFALLRAKLTESCFVPIESLVSDHLFERRRGGACHVLIQPGRRRTAVRAANFIPDAVHHGQAQIRLERPLPLRLKRVQMLQGL
jgi:hypothetical protein